MLMGLFYVRLFLNGYFLAWAGYGAILVIGT